MRRVVAGAIVLVLALAGCGGMEDYDYDEFGMKKWDIVERHVPDYGTVTCLVLKTDAGTATMDCEWPTR